LNWAIAASWARADSGMCALLPPPQSIRFGLEILHVTPPAPSHRHDRQVSIAGLAARLREHAMHLSAMMCLVIEHVRDQNPFWFAQVRLDRAGVIREFACQRCSVETVRPVDDDRIEGFTLVFQLAPIVIQRDRFGDAATRRWHAGKATHPDAIS